MTLFLKSACLPFPDQHNHCDRPEGSRKRKYTGEEVIDKRDDSTEMLWKKLEQLSICESQSLMSGQFLRDVGEDDRAAKHMRIGPSKHQNGI
ncbi:hypothetical protein CARUB_v10022474mg [Capsella rubella]|uniref:Uncharacterized protein n=1 Tax=Capsella rubella TaxID=81985 RepID=R0I9V1_9BRAS|nr:hypothetical protein CARUB_v10022474mg [Capsella rubella]